MPARQTMPRQWLIADDRLGDDLWTAVRLLPRGSGILVLRMLGGSEQRRLRHLASHRRLTIVEEKCRTSARVHNMRELRTALLARTPLILLSPIFPTGSHPEWRALPRMRAAALARLGGRKLLALGGMNPKRFARIAPLGFQGWAGISVWLRRGGLSRE